MGVPVVITQLTAFGWLEERAKVTLARDARGFEAYRKGKLVAAVAFDSWSQNACMGHIVIEDPMVLRHYFLQVCLTFAFEHADRGVMIALVAGSNTKSIKFCKHMGFTELSRIREGYSRGVDLILFEMRKKNCRWLLPLNAEAA